MSDSGGNGVNRNLLKTGGKFGEMSKNFGGGGGAAVANVNNGGGRAAAGEGGASAISHAGSGSSARRGAATAATASRASVGRRGASSGMRDLMGVRSDYRGATTSYGAGRTYDGAAAAGGIAGVSGGEIAMGGVGANGGAAQPKSTPNTALSSKEVEAPPTPTTKDAAPWQNAIQTAQIMLGLSVMLLMAAQFISKVKNPYSFMIAKAIGGLVAVMGGLIVALGAQIATGQYAQTAQGAILAAAGAGLILAGGMVAFSEPVSKGQGTWSSPSGGDPATSLDSVYSPGAGPQGNQALGSGGIADAHLFVLMGGGLATAGLVGTMMMPPQKRPSADFQNGKAPDINWFGYQQAPSEVALKKMIA
jgi:hypothetical protein